MNMALPAARLSLLRPLFRVGLLNSTYRPSITFVSQKNYSFHKTMTKSAIILLAEGAEEIELITPADVLRRAGVKVTIAGLAGAGPVKCSRDIQIMPDEALETAITKGPYDAVILPGGLKGSQNLAESAAVGTLLKKQEAEGRLVAAICAAPTALKQHGVGKGKKVTSYPSTQATMEEGGDYTYLQDRVVIDGNFITSRGPGTAFEFALALVEVLVSKEEATNLANGMILK